MVSLSNSKLINPGQTGSELQVLKLSENIVNDKDVVETMNFGFYEYVT